MQQKEQKQTLEEDTLRFIFLPLFSTNIEISYLPLHIIEIVLQFIPYLQILKFSIDYFSLDWLGQIQPIFTYLDLSYYFNNVDSNGYELIYIFSIVFMNAYWLILVSLFLLQKKLNNFGANLRKFAFIISRNVLFLPFFNIVLNMYNCSTKALFRKCFKVYNIPLQIITIASFSAFALVIIAQNFFSFDFLPHKKQFRRIRRSSFVPVAVLGFLMLNEALAYFLGDLTQLVILDMSSILLIMLVWFKDEQVTEKTKLIQLALLAVNFLALFMANIIYFTQQNLSLLLFFLLAFFLALGLMRAKTYSLKFELQNINKWTTAEIMIRYANTLRYYLSRRQQYIFKVYLHGYMEMHRQKCDNQTCPSRCELSEGEQKLFETGKLRRQDQQILRVENIVKKIYNDGYKLTPISAQLQLEYAIFLYEIGEKQVALKHLLLIHQQQLTLDRYYKYSFLKEKIHRQMVEQPAKTFLDLVSQLRVKREQETIIKRLEKAALVNLQFWSVLNQDHPDFQKLNEVAFNRIAARKAVKQSYSKISEIAHSQKVTSLYVHYLEAIENDQDMYNQIYQTVRNQYKLDDRIILQDWANSSSAIMLVSIDQGTHGIIIDINSSCACLFGYERYQVLNRPLHMLFSEEVRQCLPSFLTPSSQNEIFLLTHKSGYLIKINRKAQNYNSMETGMASVLTLSLQVTPNICFFALDNSNKIFGVSASVISLIGLELKLFEGDIFARDFFNLSIKDAICQDKERNYKLDEIISQPYENESFSNNSQRKFKIIYEQKEGFSVISLEMMTNKGSRGKKMSNSPVAFQFQVQATLDTFKYFGNFSEHEPYLSQFSQIQYAESLKQANTVRDYAQGIATLRLRDNIIQVIEEVEQQLGDNSLVKSSEATGSFEAVSRKHQEVIFESKGAYQQFINQFTFAKSANMILLIGVTLLMSTYIFYYFVYKGQLQQVQTLTSEIANQNLIIGAIAKELSLLYELQQISSGSLSSETAKRFTGIYLDNLNYLEQIKLQGSSPYQLDVNVGSANLTLLTDQFLLSFVNYATTLFANMSMSKSLADLKNIFNSASSYAVNYLIVNSKQSKELMIQNAIIRQQAIASILERNVQIVILMLIGGVLLSGLFATATLIIIHRINKERIGIFQIFLDVSEIQIQQFSAKSQKFLLSLHIEDTNGEVDVDEEVENTKKLNSSTFAKKKRFKLVNFNKSIYLHLLVVPLIALAYFAHTFGSIYSALYFQIQSYHYFFLTSQGDYNFYTGLSTIQKSLLTQQSLPTNISESYISYYRDYFNLHFTTFGYVNDFHQAFTDVFMLDTCQGISTAYGTTKIPASCEIPFLSSNGSYLVFTDIAMNTQFFTTNQSMTYQYLVGYQVMSKTHRLLTQNLLAAQADLLNGVSGNLLSILLIWALLLGIFSLTYGIPIMKIFVDQVNEVKNILSILPISVARGLPLAPAYFNRILKAQNCC